MNDFEDDLNDDGSVINYDLDNGVTMLGATKGDTFIAAGVDSTISSNNKLPKEWSNLLGCRFGTFREKCRRALSEKAFEIILDEDAEIIVVSPSKKYRIYLAFDVNTSKFVALLITLNECPYCKSNNFALRKINAETYISYCTDCDKPYLFKVESEELDEVEENDTPSCPNCSSDDVDDDGSDYLQYTCNDCGHNWGHDDTVECPECGSDDVENDGTDNLQYTCNDCGHNWGDDDTVECPECGSDDVENDGTDNLQYECNACGHMWGDDEDSENEEYDNDVEDEYDDDTDNAGNQMSEYFEAFGVILGKSTKFDLERLGGEPWKDNPDKYWMRNNRFNVYLKDNIVYKMDFLEESIPMFYKGLGLYWGMNKEKCDTLFRNLGFRVSSGDNYCLAFGYCKKYCTLFSVWLSPSFPKSFHISIH